MGIRYTETSPALRDAVKTFHDARQGLAAIIQSEHPGQAVIVGRSAFSVGTGRNGSPVLVVQPAVIHKNKPAPAPAENPQPQEDTNMPLDAERWSLQQTALLTQEYIDANGGGTEGRLDLIDLLTSGLQNCEALSDEEFERVKAIGEEAHRRRREVR